MLCTEAALSQSPGMAVGIHQQPDTTRDKESEVVEIHAGGTHTAPFLRPHLPEPRRRSAFFQGQLGRHWFK